MARIGELAGCTRALVYRYFPTRQDVYAAIAGRFYEELDAHLSASEQAGALATGSLSHVATKRLFEATWAAMESVGPAAAILRCAPELSPEFAAYLADLRETHEGRFRGGLEQAGLTRPEADLLLDLLSSALKATVTAWQRGEMTRDQARAAHERASRALLRSFLRTNRPRPGARGARQR